MEWWTFMAILIVGCRKRRKINFSCRCLWNPRTYQFLKKKGIALLLFLLSTNFHLFSNSSLYSACLCRLHISVYEYSEKSSDESCLTNSLEHFFLEWNRNGEQWDITKFMKAKWRPDQRCSTVQTDTTRKEEFPYPKNLCIIIKSKLKAKKW